jgi:hypothetical protein
VSVSHGCERLDRIDIAMKKQATSTARGIDLLLSTMREDTNTCLVSHEQLRFEEGGYS